MKIGLKLVLGFLIVALLVVVTGAVGFNAVNSVKKQANILDASKNMLLNIKEERSNLRQYILTEDSDKLAQIMEKNGELNELIKMWIEALGHGTDSAEFKSKEDVYKTWVEGGYKAESRSVVFDPEIGEKTEELEKIWEEEFKDIGEKLRVLHDEMIVTKTKFAEEYPKEKEERHGMRDIIYLVNDAQLNKIYGLMIYFSKEALYQYRDQKHIDEWLSEIQALKTEVTSSTALTSEKRSSLLKSLDEYYPRAKTMGNLALEIKQKEDAKLAQLELIDESIVTIKEKEEEITSIVITKTKEAQIKIISILVGVIIVTFILAIGLGVFTSRSISEPIKKMTAAADNISKGVEKVEPLPVTSSDEIGKLTESFNRMITQVNILMKEVGKKWDKEDNKKK